MLKLFDKITVTQNDPIKGFELFAQYGLNEEKQVRIWKYALLLNEKYYDMDNNALENFDLYQFYAMISTLLPHERVSLFSKLHWCVLLHLIDNIYVKPYLTRFVISNIIQESENHLIECVTNGHDSRFHLIDITNHVSTAYNFCPAFIQKWSEKIMKVPIVTHIFQQNQQQNKKLLLGPRFIQSICHHSTRQAVGNNLIIDLFIIDETDEWEEGKCVSFDLGHTYEINNNNNFYQLRQDSSDSNTNTQPTILIHKHLFRSIQQCMLESNSAFIYDVSSKKMYCTLPFYIKQTITTSTISISSLPSTSNRITLQQLHSRKQKNMYAKCYQCKKLFRKTVHNTLESYKEMCVVCGIMNYSKRIIHLSLPQKIAMVTGCRIKIGYQLCLHLLRTGAYVIGTTRFPFNALYRYQQEPDYDNFRDRLCLYKLDLRNIPVVETFIEFVKSRHDHLDILINNAAQTFTYDKEYYQKMSEYENDRLQQFLLCEETQNQNQNQNHNHNHNHNDMVEFTLPPDQKNIVTKYQQDVELFHAHSLVEQLKTIKLQKWTFETDRFGELITTGGVFWQQNADQVTTMQLLECNFVNQVAPSMFISQFKTMMKKSPHVCKYVINVVCQEGRFNMMKKPVHHFHTNMSKSALNMITRTISEDYKKDNIFVNSVDPGWCSFALDTNRTCPISTIDAARRILDPIYQGEYSFANSHHTQHIPHGKLWRHYQVSSW